MSQMPKIMGEKVLIDCYGKVVIERRFRDSDGKKRKFLLWGGKVTPVIILPVTSDKKVIAIQLFRRAANEYLIEIPGGNPKVGESIEVCGRRELFEEAGYTAEKLVKLGPALWFDPSNCLTKFLPILALDCQETLKGQMLAETEKAESVKVVLIELAEWLRMIRSGEIRDSKTITVTFLAIPYL